MFERADEYKIIFAACDTTASAGPSAPGTADIPNLSAMLKNNLMIVESSQLGPIDPDPAEFRPSSE